MLFATFLWVRSLRSRFGRYFYVIEDAADEETPEDEETADDDEGDDDEG